RHGRLVHGGVSETGVEVAGDVGRRGRSADPTPPHRGAYERDVPAVVFRDHRAGEVQGGPRDVGVDGHRAGEGDHALRVDRTVGLHAGDDPAVADANVPDLSVDAVSGVVDLPARDP